ncbi:protein phosphatase 2C domain-containing protein [Actinomadura oligospora]|uniref:protein phosphatase 2C domain-containing protein n=1 Tax=Actinomadura oligospora TaxID=111804 RepID=UPI000557A89D|nr:protein phosphatase 2C domain-containing protein [Actinomadura oligospora]
MDVAFASRAKEPGRANEDYVLAASDMVVLLDGAGVPPEAETGCRHGLPWFVRTLGEQLLNAARAGDISLAEALKRAIERTALAHADTCDPSHPVSPSSTVVAVRRRDEYLDWLVLGDSFLALRKHSQIEVITDQRLKQSAVKQRTALRQADGRDRALWNALVAEERRLRNHPDGFWIAAGDPEAADHAMTGCLPLADLTHALLLSDGGARPVEPFGAVTWDECFHNLAQSGPAAWLRRVREIENADPDRTRWPRSKRHDDATALLIGLEDDA